MRIDRRARLLVLGAVVAAALGAACRKKGEGGPSPEITGLAAVPANAEVLIGVDVGKLAASPIVGRAIERLLLSDAQLAQRWEDLRSLCKLEIQQLNRILLARGPAPKGGRPGTGPSLLVATGQIAEPEILKCVREVVGKGGGSLTVKTVDDRSLYQVKDGNRTVYLAFGRADTVVVGTSDTYTAEALGPGKKAAEHPELAAWLKLVDQRSPVWAVGRAPEPVRAGLVRVSQEQLKAGPTAFAATADLTSGANLELAAVMASPDDAKALESIAKAQLTAFVWAAQLKQLGGVVKKVAITSAGNTVRFKAPLDMNDVNHVLGVLDGGKPAEAPGAGGSAEAPPAGTPEKQP